MTYAERNIVRGFFGNFDALPTIKKVKVSFEVEYAGSGTAGTAPAYDGLLQACGAAPPTCRPRPDLRAGLGHGQDALDLLQRRRPAAQDGLGRGNAVLKIKANDIPFIAFEFIGLDTGATDTAILTPTSFGTYKTPLAANKANTPTFSFFGVARSRSNPSSSTSATRTSRSRASARSRSAHGPQERRLDHDRDDLGRDEGLDVPGEERDARCAEPRARLGAGAVMTVAAANVELQSPQFSNIQGIQMVQFGLRFNPTVAGNDEWSIANT
jgi:hypothetical protein